MLAPAGTTRGDVVIVEDAVLGELRDALAGQAIGPDDVGYDAARVCFNAVVDCHPAVIVRCLGAADVATAFDFARAHGLEIAVRGGGHHPARHCAVEAGVVIDDGTPTLRAKQTLRPREPS